LYRLLLTRLSNDELCPEIVRQYEYLNDWLLTDKE
jgi:hypothetical protein